MFLITFPNYSMKKRFIGLEQALPIGASLKIASKLYIYIHVLGAILAVVLIIIVKGDRGI